MSDNKLLGMNYQCANGIVQIQVSLRHGQQKLSQNSYFECSPLLQI